LKYAESLQTDAKNKPPTTKTEITKPKKKSKSKDKKDKEEQPKGGFFSRLFCISRSRSPLVAKDKDKLYEEND
jgi:hypothetical protein